MILIQLFFMVLAANALLGIVMGRFTPSGSCSTQIAHLGGSFLAGLCLQGFVGAVVFVAAACFGLYAAGKITAALPKRNSADDVPGASGA